MKIITTLHLTLVDGMEIQIDSLDAHFTVVWDDGFAATDADMPLLDLRDLLLAGTCRALVLEGIFYNGTERVTLTIFPDSIINMVSNDTEVLLPL